MLNSLSCFNRESIFKMSSVDYQNAFALAKALNVKPPAAPSAVEFTENGAPALPSTGNACVDLFFKVTQTAKEDMVKELLELAWMEDSLTALKIVAYFRSCLKGVPGQGARNPARYSYKWMIDNHPATFNVNMETLIKFGYWGDLKHLRGTNMWPLALVIWARSIIEIKNQMIEWLGSNEVTPDQYLISPFPDAVPDDDDSFIAASAYTAPVPKGKKRVDMTAEKCRATGKWKSLAPLPQIDDFGAIKFVPPRQTGKNKPKTKETANNLIRAELRKAIAMLVDEQVDDKTFRRVYLRLAAKRLDLVEEKVCAKHHDRIDYSAVPSKANKRHVKSFKEHDGVRFAAYLESVKKGDVKINTSRLMCHEIVQKAGDSESDAWWKGMHNYLDDQNVWLDDWIAVVDVSGSMQSGGGGIAPIDASRGLGLMIAERKHDGNPFKNFFITFSAKARMRTAKGNTLQQRLSSLNEGMGYNTNFVSVATELISQYKVLNVPQEKMLKKLVVLTDMEHDDGQCNQAACVNPKCNGGDSWGNCPCTDKISVTPKTSFDQFAQVFTDAGCPVPTVVFWNLASRNIHYPVYSGKADVALISGFSSDILMLLLKDGEISPTSMLKTALEHEVYQQLRVVD